jgi:hypothetical protein
MGTPCGHGSVANAGSELEAQVFAGITDAREIVRVFQLQLLRRAETGGLRKWLFRRILLDDLHHARDLTGWQVFESYPIFAGENRDF